MMIGVVDVRVWQRFTHHLCLRDDTPQLVVLKLNLEGSSCHAYEQSHTILAKMVERGDDEC